MNVRNKKNNAHLSGPSLSLILSLSLSLCLFLSLFPSSLLLSHPPPQINFEKEIIIIIDRNKEVYAAIVSVFLTVR